MSRAAFLAHLRADPADLTAWLAYADWLDEQDDPTGAFVRLSLDFTAGRVPVEPEFAHADRLDELAAAADPDTREAMADYRSGLPVRLQVCGVMRLGPGPEAAYPAVEHSVVLVAVLAGRVAAGARLTSEDRRWRPRRPVSGVEVFAEVLERAEAGRGPTVVGLYYAEPQAVAAGTILVEDAG
ncbi:MAG: hypothetical protein C0501_09675 [Isosphaera sp.]|nr:hypothetical protein [Isosphaera sp.]